MRWRNPFRYIKNVRDKNAMKIILISCVSKKEQVSLPAKNLYISTWFQYAYRYAEQSKSDKIFILSAKYGLLSPERVIEPYNETLNKMKKEQRQIWGEKVLKSLRQECNLETDEFVILAGKKYREQIISHLTHYKVPMEGMRIGQQLSFLKNAIERERYSC